MRDRERNIEHLEHNLSFIPARYFRFFFLKTVLLEVIRAVIM